MEIDKQKMGHYTIIIEVFKFGDGIDVSKRLKIKRPTGFLEM